MADIKIEMLPALSGDCFLVTTYGENRTNVVIDAGYGETYEDYLKDRLDKVKELGDSINLMVITHIDADHIGGAIKFLEENNTAIQKEDFIRIDEVWHNSLRHIHTERKDEKIIEGNDKMILEALKMKGMQSPLESRERRNKKISAIQGSVLGGLIKSGNYNWNVLAKEKAICIENLHTPCSINDIKITLLSPNLERLNNLKEEWENKLRQNKKFKGEITTNEIFDDVFEILLGESFDINLRNRHKLINSNIDLISYLQKEEDKIDDGAINSSSISFVLEFKGKKVLFLGDSNPDDIFNKVKEMYAWDGKSMIFFDAIKISHHGSRSNTNIRLLEMIDSKKFIISTNGRAGHNHPHFEAIAKIVCRESEYTRELIFNYENSAEKFNNKNWMVTYNYKIKEVKDGEIQEIYL